MIAVRATVLGCITYAAPARLPAPAFVLRGRLCGETGTALTSAVLLPCCNSSPVTTPFLSLRLLSTAAGSCCVADLPPPLLSNVPSVDLPPPPSLRRRLLLMTRAAVARSPPLATLMVRLLGMMVLPSPSMPCRRPCARGVLLSEQQFASTFRRSVSTTVLSTARTSRTNHLVRTTCRVHHQTSIQPQECCRTLTLTARVRIPCRHYRRKGTHRFCQVRISLMAWCTHQGALT